MFVLDQITINLNNPGQRQRIYASVGDSGTRAVEVKLITNDGDWHIPDGVSCVIRFAKADGHQGVYYSLPDGSNAWTVSGNVLTCVLAEQVLTCPGIVEVSAMLAHGTERLGVFGFDIHVAHDAMAELEASSDYFSIESLEEINAAFAEITSDLGRKAPAGYGLGGTNGAVVTDANNATNNGWYTVYNGGTNLPGTSFGGSIHVKAFPANNIIQHLYYTGHGGGECRRICVDGVWGQWEYIAPALYVGLEYRTTERYMGKAVYTLLVDLGTLPVSENKYVYPSIPNNATIVSIAGIATDGKYYYPFPLANANGVRGVIFTAFDANNQFYVCVRANQDCSALTAKVEIKYTKD